MYNTAAFIGNITKKIELRKTDAGVEYVRFIVACNNPFARDPSKKTDFIPVIFWKERAVNLAKYTSKGDQILIEGRMSYQMVGEKHFFNISGRNFEFLTNKKDKKDDDEWNTGSKQLKQKYGE